jgi:DNA-binding XRE family transcriptional regulator
MNDERQGLGTREQGSGRLGRRQKSQAQKEFDARLGGLIYELRKARGMPAKELAFVIGVTQQQLCNYETGEHAFPVFFLEQVCRYMGIASPDLLQAANVPVCGIGTNTSYCGNSKKRCAQCLTSA